MQIEKFSEPNVKTSILGNKADSDAKKIEQENIDEFSAEKGVSSYPVSAKTGEGVLEAVTDMVRELMKIHPKA